MNFARFGFLVPLLQSLLLLAKAQSNQNEETFLEACVKNVRKSIDAKVAMLTDVKEGEKKTLSELLAKEFEKILQHEKRALEVKYIKRRVQFTNITDAISLNQRIFSHIESTIIQFKNETGKSLNRQNVYTLDMLLEELLEDCKLGNVFCYTPIGQEAVCDPLPCSDRYRRSDGVCNNLNSIHSKHWGATGIAMRRFSATAYESVGTAAPRGGFNPSSLPSTRDISTALHKSIMPEDTTLTSKGLTLMTMQFAQFLDHDITLTPEQELDCCNEKFLKWDESPNDTPLNVRRCFNIPVKEAMFGDPLCHSFTRSDAICVDSNTREQINGLTAFVDGSNVYGSDHITSVQLRKMSDGLLKINSDPNLASTQNLPTRLQAGLTIPGSTSDPDLVAGDVRVIEQPTLAAMHTMFLNEHNRIAKNLKNCLPEVLQTDDILYEETRKVVGAELQNIVYEEFLPLVLGEDTINMFNLKLSDDTEYKPNQDPSILNEFATVAYRFGHTLIPDIFQGNGPRSLKNHFFQFDNTVTCPFPTLPNTGKCWMDEMKEVINQQSPASDVEIADSVRENLFSPPHEFPDDLMARNLQRGRDHGITSYLELLEEAKKFCPNLTHQAIPQSRWNDILAAYNNDKGIIDPFAAGLAETSANDAVVGPLFACIIGEQFRRLKDGDRYFFMHTSGSEHVRGVGPHTKSSIRKRTLGDIICDNTDVEETQRAVMRQTSGTNPLQSCYDKNPLNFECIADDIIRDRIDCLQKEIEISGDLPKNLETLKAELDELEIAIDSSKCSYSPAPGNCATKDWVPVDTDMEWKHQCQDIQGNLIQEATSLLSCCGCFRYTCTSIHDHFSWVKTLVDQCCQTCDGEVYSGGSVISVREEVGQCGSTVTTECISYGAIQPAKIEERYSYTECCGDQTGLHPLGTIKPDPSTCSVKHCQHSPGRAEAAWVSSQKCGGCDCCEYNATLVCDGHNITTPGGELFQCCEGKIIKSEVENSPGNEAVLITGKYFTSSYRGVELWSPGGKCNRRLLDLPGTRQYYGQATIYFDGLVLVCGGRRLHKKDPHVCLKLDPETEIWTEHSILLNSKKTEMSFFAHVIVGNRLYLLGGESQSNPSIHSQYLEIGSTTWQEGPELPAGTYYRYGCADPDSNDSFILISQGNNPPVFQYNISTDSWHSLPVIPFQNVYEPACGRVGNGILVAFRDQQSLTHSLVLDVTTQTWSEVGDFVIPSGYTSILDVSGRYFKIGRNNPVLEEYQPYSKTWQLNMQPLLSGNTRSQVDGATVPKYLFNDCS